MHPSISFDLGLCIFQRLDRRYAVWGEGVGLRVFLVVFENQLIPELLQACRPWDCEKNIPFFRSGNWVIGWYNIRRIRIIFDHIVSSNHEDIPYFLQFAAIVR